ncbi:hypothetical protein QR680_019335 [Steinernema hermaphroditum]|uniref:Uncharacterized protein n=1 Tax=Steinernema hermaphroditum TaxID=289476 RepID=A0AA39GN23_9BILA|nr:hypothetical protein QR680_019335 [Steinernema hermaphroditum]
MNSTNANRLLVSKGVFSSTPKLQIAFSMSNLTIIALVVWVSLKIDRRDVSRLYTLWLYLAHAPSDFVMIAISSLQLYGLVDSSGNHYRDELSLTLMIGKVFQDIASQVYRVLALIMVLVTFSSYTFPATFQKYFHPSKRSNLYMMGFTFICCFCVAANAFTLIQVHLPDALSDITRTVLFYSMQFIAVSPTIIMMVLYTLSVVVIVRFSKRSALSIRRQLIAVIIYTTSPNILLFPALVMNVFNILIAEVPREQKLPTHPYFVASAYVQRVVRCCGYELIYNMSRFFKAFKESVHGFNLVLRAMRQNYGKEVDRGQLLAAWQELQEDHTKKPAAKRWKKYEVNLAFLNEKEAKKVPKPKPVKRKAVKKVSPMAISIQLPPAPSKGCLKRSLEDQEQPAAPSPKVLRWADETASEGGLEVEEEESPEQENVDEERVDILSDW